VISSSSNSAIVVITPTRNLVCFSNIQKPVSYFYPFKGKFMHAGGWMRRVNMERVNRLAINPT
jgi:hypothetical protein